MKRNKHSYAYKRWLREKLPWFLIDLGIASKGKNCELINAKHYWYNIDNKITGCYYCKKISKTK